jgi:hypothetical protein
MLINRSTIRSRATSKEENKVKMGLGIKIIERMQKRIKCKSIQIAFFLQSILLSFWEQRQKLMTRNLPGNDSANML